MFIGGDRLAQNSSKKDKQDDFLRAGIAGASYETVQRYGSALKEHLVGFSGADNETGTRLQKSLKSIQALEKHKIWIEGLPDDEYKLEKIKQVKKDIKQVQENILTTISEIDF